MGDVLTIIERVAQKFVLLENERTEIDIRLKCLNLKGHSKKPDNILKIMKKE